MLSYGHHSFKKIKPGSKGVAYNLFDARTEHMKELDLLSQIRLAKVDPMIPFHGERKGYSCSQGTKGIFCL